MPIHLDELNRSIVARLLEDATVTNAVLAERLHSSEATIRRRRKLLTEQGVIRQSIVADPFQLGYTVMALIGLQVEAGHVERIATQLRELGELRFVGLTLGRYDILAEAWFRSNDELLTLVNGKLGGIPGIQRTETLQVLRFVKYAYDWGQTSQDLRLPT